MIPVLLKELRGTLRERRGYLVPILYMLVLAAVTSLVYAAVDTGVQPGATASEASATDVGKAIAGTLAVLQGIAVLLVAPLVGSALVAGERERGTWLRLLASPVSRAGLLFGKATAGALYLGLLLSCSLPEALLAFGYGGLDTPALLGLYFSQALLAAVLLCLGLAVSTLFQRAWVAGLVALGGALVLTVLSVTIYGWSAATRPEGAQASRDLFERLVLDLDPLQSWFLFFQPPGPHSLVAWWSHLGLMALLGGLALLFAWTRLRRATE